MGLVPPQDPLHHCHRMQSQTSTEIISARVHVPKVQSMYLKPNPACGSQQTWLIAVCFRAQAPRQHFRAPREDCRAALEASESPLTEHVTVSENWTERLVLAMSWVSLSYYLGVNGSAPDCWKVPSIQNLCSDSQLVKLRSKFIVIFALLPALRRARYSHLRT